MEKNLKTLDETIAEIEAEVDKNPDLFFFLFSTLERLNHYRDNDVVQLIDKVQGHKKHNRPLQTSKEHAWTNL